MSKNLDTLIKALMNAPISKVHRQIRSEINDSKTYYRSLFECTFTTTIAPHTYRVTKYSHFTGNCFEGYTSDDNLTVEVLNGERLLWSCKYVDGPLSKPQPEAHKKIDRLYTELDKKFKKGEVIPHRQEEDTSVN